MMAVTAVPMVMMMARAVVGMHGVMRRLRNLIGMLVVDRLCPFYLDYFGLTSRCLRNLMGMLALVVGRFCPFYLDYLVLTRFSVWLRTGYVGLLPGDNALRNSRCRRKRNCYCQSGSQNIFHGLFPRQEQAEHGW